MDDLIDRYASAVASHLPKAERGDIAEELRQGLAARREDAEAELGRPLRAAEVAEMLKAFGNPITVAGRYRKRQYLIGPDLYPYYLRSLSGLLTLIAVLAALRSLPAVWDGDLARAVTIWIGLFWEVGLLAALSVTLTFAVMEAAPGVRALGANWNPLALPPVNGLPRRTLGELIFEIVASGVFLLFWTEVWSFDRAPSVTAAQIWDQLYWPVLLLFAGGVVANLLDLIRPRWAINTSWLNLAVNLAIAAVVLLLFASRPWVEGEDAGLVRNVELTIGVILAIVGLISASEAWADWKSIRKAGGMMRHTATA
jgi:hypothetical protein